MAIVNRLFALAEREFKANRAAPVRETFRGMKINIGKYDEMWDRKRGAAARMMGVILREDDATLHGRVCEDGKALKTYKDAASWLVREADYLRKTAGLLDTAASRVSAVVERCEREGTTQAS